MYYYTAWGKRAVQTMQRTAPSPNPATRVMCCPTPGGGGQCKSCNAVPHCLGAVELLSFRAILPKAIGQWDSCTTTRYRLGG